MKVLSVIILVALPAVTVVAFSEASNTGSTSPEYILRHAHRSNSPVFQRVNEPAINSQIVDKLKSRPLSNQYDLPRRPRTSYPIYPAVPGIPNTAPRFNPQINNRHGKFSPQGTWSNHVLSDPNIKAIYAATKPTKRYTVIHPNGTIEHTDELHVIVARHPNYVMVKADDILRTHNHRPIAPTRTTPVHNNGQSIQNLPLASSESVSLDSKFGKPIAATSEVPYQRPTENFQSSTGLRKQQFLINPANTIQEINKYQAAHRNFYKQTAPIVQTTVPKNIVSSVPVTNAPLQIQKPISPPNPLVEQNLQNQYQDKINKNAIPKTLHGNAVALNPSAVYKAITNQKSSTTSTSNAHTVSKSSFSKTGSNEKDNKAHDNAVAINPLPVYSGTSVPQVTTISAKVNESPAAVDAKDHPAKVENKNEEIIINPLVLSGINEAVLAYHSTISSNENNKGKQTFSVTLPNSVEPTNTLQIPAERVPHESLSVLLPEVATQNTSKIVLEPASLEGLSKAKSTPDVTTIAGATTTIDKNKTTSPEVPSTLEASSDKIIGLSSTKDALNGTNIQFDTTITSANKSNVNLTGDQLTIQSKIEIASVHGNKRNVTKEPSATSSAEAPLSWFEFDEETMERILNNTHNVYFFFVPSEPKIVKDTRTTIYPNGTTVQEIIETQVVPGEDGEPEVKQRKTITCT